MIRRTIIFLLAVAGGYLLASGISQWRDQREARRAATAFMDELVDADAVPTSAAYEILQVDRRGNAAIANVTVACGDCRVESQLTLARAASGAWVIDSHRLREDLTRAQADRDGQRLAVRLAQAFRSRTSSAASGPASNAH